MNRMRAWYRACGTDRNMEKDEQCRGETAREAKRYGPGRAPGFTLMELLVVIAIITVLVSFLATAVMRAITNAQITATRSDIAQLNVALELYAGYWGTFPPDDGEIGGDGFESSVSMVKALLSTARGGPCADFPSDKYDISSVEAGKGLLDIWGQAFRYHWSTQSPMVTAVGQSGSAINMTYNTWSIGPDEKDDEDEYNADYPEPRSGGGHGDDIVSY